MHPGQQLFAVVGENDQVSWNRCGYASYVCRWNAVTMAGKPGPAPRAAQ
ncbi:hypothetical protein [Paractinoplanes durhamensis]